MQLLLFKRCREFQDLFNAFLFVKFFDKLKKHKFIFFKFRRRKKHDTEVPDYFRKYVKKDPMEDLKNLEPLYFKYKDSRAHEREEEEKRLAQELEELKRKARFPIPNLDDLFNQMHKPRHKQRTATSQFCILLGIMASVVLLNILLSK